MFNTGKAQATWELAHAEASDRQIPSGRIFEGNHESECLKSSSSLPAQPTYLTHDVFIIRQCQPEVCDVSIVALMEHREKALGLVWAELFPPRGPGQLWCPTFKERPLVMRTEEAVGLSHERGPRVGLGLSWSLGRGCTPSALTLMEVRFL